MTYQTIDNEEVNKFDSMSDQWWQEEGNFQLLHNMNITRLEFITQSINPKNLKVLDIGCGGGILSEPLSRLGASVTAIDPSKKNIEQAKQHAEKHGLVIDYRHSTLEEETKLNHYDIICALEVIEHVASPEDFIRLCSSLLKKQGSIFISTISKTIQAFIGAIIGAEYIFGMVPKGTHDWKKFLTPAEVYSIMSCHKLQLQDISGMSFNLFNKQWKLSKNTKMNYIIHAKKKV